jgi:antitoxin MazE
MPPSQVVKWGNSLAVRIPKKVAEGAHLQEGDPIVIEVSNGHIELRPAEIIPTLEELVAQITLENRHGELSIGRERGREKGEW